MTIALEKKATRVAIVTGASRGIGAAIARQLAKDGCAVVLGYVNGAQEAAEVAQSIVQAGGKASAVQADVTQSEGVAHIFAQAQDIYGGVDILINNAGLTTPKPTPIAEMTDEWYDRIFSVNTRGSFLAMRAAAKVLRNGGRVINISTSAIGLALPGYAAYAGSKAAVESFSLILARELRGRSITVNTVAPGPTATDFFYQGKDDAAIERFTKMSPLERLGQPQDIAKVVAFLAGSDGEWVNGQLVRVNGGIV
jgi:3-oxoacyl-[acyl-carrier protein] reductase